MLPALAAPPAPGLQERVLWQEPLRAVVPADHPLTRLAAPVPTDALVDEPLVLTGASGDAMPEALDMLARRGAVATAAATADGPATVGALVRVH